MGVIKLELRSPKVIDGIAPDPQPDWSFDTLLLELNSIEQKLSANVLPFAKTEFREIPASQGSKRTSKGFMMHISDDDLEDIYSDSEGEVQNQLVAAGRRFACNELYISDSDDSDNESNFGIQCQLMEPVGLVESALSEITHEHQLGLSEEMRNRVSSLEADLLMENEKFVSTLARVEKYAETKRDMDTKFDMQYQRRIAEALDNHLTAVQRDHEHRSQIEEKRIRDDAAREEARRREKALQDEKARQEKLKAEAESQARLEAERIEAEKAAAEEAERRAAKEAAEKNASQASTNSALVASRVPEGTRIQPNVSKNVQQAGNIVRGAESALKLEERRLQIYKELTAGNEALGLGSNKEYRKCGMQIARIIRQISGTRESVSDRANDLTKLVKDSAYPQSIVVAMLAEKFVSVCANSTGTFNSALYAYGHVIVNVTSKIPHAMDILIAELNRVCIFTVPKYISYSETAFESREAHRKAIGYQFEDGKIEDDDSFLQRLVSCMRLYGALVQTEGMHNLHGITEGWAWLARFLNALPANLYTATALHAFLEMAGFALFRRYRSQFAKLLIIVENDFLKALKASGDSTLNKVIVNIQNYMESRQYAKEPEGRQLKDQLESSHHVPDSGYEEGYHNPSNRSYQYNYGGYY